MNAAFTTVLDDKYFPGFLMTLNSMLKVSKNFSYDIIILDWGELAEDNKEIIKGMYKNIQFRNVDKHFYENHQYDETWRKWTYNCNYRFDIFTYSEYDRIVFFDSDILFEIDVEEILKYDVDFGSCDAGIGRVTQINGRQGFDGGIMSIGKKFLNENTRQELLNIANQLAPFDPNIKSKKWVSDEPILNTYFLDKMVWLPEEFNMVISKLNNTNIKRKNNYQFTGHNKPWYGEKLEDRFSSFNFSEIVKNETPYMVKVILRKISNKYDVEVKDLLNKGIDINKYAGKIKPIYD
jgi:lipopolysaccharide biosynthesis glycosyltransferase